MVSEVSGEDKPCQMKKRRRLPVLERPKSAPLTGQLINEDSTSGVFDVCHFSSGQATMKTVIKVNETTRNDSESKVSDNILHILPWSRWKLNTSDKF